MSIPENGHLPASASLPDHYSASDSDGEPDADYYRPISSAAADSDSDSGSDADPDAAMPHHRLDETHNGIAALDRSSDEDEDNSDEYPVEEDVTPGEAAAAQAFSEDEQRRRAPLPAEAAARIVDAMRGVEFPGAPPPWAGSVPEDQWVDRLRSLRAGRPN